MSLAPLCSFARRHAGVRRLGAASHAAVRADQVCETVLECVPQQLRVLERAAGVLDMNPAHDDAVQRRQVTHDRVGAWTAPVRVAQRRTQRRLSTVRQSRQLLEPSGRDARSDRKGSPGVLIIRASR